MKTYIELITELNKTEAMMKAGKLAVKTIQRLAPKNQPTYLLQGIKGTSKKSKIPLKNILFHRDSPSSKIVSPRRKIENIVRGTKTPEAQLGGKLDTATRQKQFNRSRNSKADANYFDTLTPNIMRQNIGRRARGLKDAPLRRGLGDHPGYLDASKQLDQPASVHKNFKAAFPDQYPTNKLGNLSPKGVKYDKVPDSIENKIRDAIRRRKKK